MSLYSLPIVKYEDVFFFHWNVAFCEQLKYDLGFEKNVVINVVVFTKISPLQIQLRSPKHRCCIDVVETLFYSSACCHEAERSSVLVPKLVNFRILPKRVYDPISRVLNGEQQPLGTSNSIAYLLAFYQVFLSGYSFAR